ncbi:hypothetical protein GCM10023085_45360 [Actinomadura viridis]|uniref:Uncharacterized protein n=1 Tax=Actinomadura viridis TaxID=58110 RepID=A0A931DLQ1_9ACTN|nr:hypothetical protein [Actinomadura viridis]MBG6089896.1 hypothetical protein [Actinomadura viridis]
MTLKRPLYMQAGGGDSTFSYSALDNRDLLSGLMHQEGIVAPDVVYGALKVTQRAAGANFSVDIAPGRCAIVGDDVSNQGYYMCQSTAVENLTVPSPPGTGSRTHRVVARVKDKLHNGSWSTYEWTLEVLEDSGSGTPAVPASAISLATVSVAAGQSSVQDGNITDTRLSAALISSKYPLVGSDSTRPPAGYDSELIYRTDRTTYEMANGGSWFEIPRRNGGGAAWTTYTPALTAVTSTPALGTGALREGAYIRYGPMVTVRANIKAGTSGASGGSGVYMVSLPVAAKALSVGEHIGSAETFDASANNVRDGICRIRSATSWTAVEIVTENTLWGSSGPFAWANNDQLSITITYEAA